MMVFKGSSLSSSGWPAAGRLRTAVWASSLSREASTQSNPLLATHTLICANYRATPTHFRPVSCCVHCQTPNNSPFYYKGESIIHAAPQQHPAPHLSSTAQSQTNHRYTIFIALKSIAWWCELRACFLLCFLIYRPPKEQFHQIFFWTLPLISEGSSYSCWLLHSW